jgi:hypothetical protein
MRGINCSECGKHLFNTERQSDGAAGAEAIRLGFVFKMPFLYTKESGCLFFCTKECSKEYYRKNIHPNPEADRILKEYRENIPEMTKDLCKGLQGLSDKLKKEFGE